MFSLIITIISIALVAVLALATLYYGGDAFNKGSADAQAAKVVNQGQQLLGAAEMFFVDNKAWPTNVQALIAGGYLKSAPVAYQGNGTVAQAWAAAAWEMPTAGQPVFVATLESNQACQAVNKRTIGEDVLLTEAFPNLLTQCYEGSDNQLRAVVSKNASALAAVAVDGSTAVPGLLPAADISATAYAAAAGGTVGAGSGVLQLWGSSDASDSQRTEIQPGGAFVFNSGTADVTLTSVSVTDAPSVPYDASLEGGTVCTPGMVLAPSTSCFVNVSISGVPGSLDAGTQAGTLIVTSAVDTLSIPVTIPLGFD